MKKIIMFAVLAVAMVFAASCSKEDGKKVDVEKIVKAPVEAAKPGLEPKADVKDQAPAVVKAPVEPVKVPEATTPTEPVKTEEVKPVEPEKKVEPVKRASVEVVEIPADSNIVYKILHTRYIGWEFYGYMRDSGIMDKWASKYGVKVEVVFFGDYADSIGAYSSQEEVVGVTVTNMDAITLGFNQDTEVVIVGDYSNGNDQWIAPGDVTTFEQLVKMPCLIQLGTVSEVFQYRCLMIHAPEIDASAIELKMTNESDMVNSFKNSQGMSVVTWNPHAMNISQQVTGAHTMCSSAEIPGEILDLLAMKKNAPTAVKKAAVGAWYETLAELKTKDPAVQRKVLEYIAQQTDMSVPAIESQLATTAMYYTPQDALAYVMGEQLPQTMEFIRTFCFEHKALKIYPETAQSKDDIGIAFPDGSIQGNKEKVRLTFNPAYMQLAADGKL